LKLSRIDQLNNMSRYVHDKEDAGRFDREKKREPDSHDKKEPKEKEKIEVTEDKVTEAIAALSREDSIKSAGLNVSVKGQGPGLKVTLTDGTGAVVRQLSAEEFLKLRKLTLDGKTHGKILDEKA